MNQSLQLSEPLKPGGHLPDGLPFSEGMAVDNLVFLSGQLGRSTISSSCRASSALFPAGSN
jgi:enamine deaminase RidA (YjgF/YER057c/UK114 family)